MTFSYDSSSSGLTLQLNRVRLECGDTDATWQLLQDSEIGYAGSVEGSDLATAARCCEMISALFSRRADMQEGKLSIKLSQRAEAYARKAFLLRALGSATDAVPCIGGESIADKNAANDDTDRVQPAFTRNMLDNPDAIGVAIGDTDPQTD